MEKFILKNQEIQNKIKKMQNEISKFKIIGNSGAGLVKVTINGIYICQSINIDKSLLKENKLIVEDLIIAAFNDAVNQVNQIQKEKMLLITSNIDIPFNLNTVN